MAPEARCSAVPVSWVASSQLSLRQTGPWAPKDLLLSPACTILPRAPGDRRGHHRGDGPLFQQCTQDAGLEPSLMSHCSLACPEE